MTCDTVKSFNLVLPNGTITTVDASKSDLFFALKGGLNRFGIISSIVYNTVPQTNQVYAGIQVYSASDIPSLLNFTQNLQKTNTDPKVGAILTLNGGTLSSLVDAAILLLFYDGPTAPPQFAPLASVGTSTISTVKSQDFASFISGVPSSIQAGNRGAFHTLMTDGITLNYLKAVYNESTYYGDLSILHGGSLLSYDVEPFIAYGQHATDSAFPHANSPLPLNLYFAWSDASQDAFWRGIMQQSINHLIDVAKAEGIYNADMYAYPNYALDTYTGEQLYGPTNAARLRSIRGEIDPSNIMLLSGGFTI